MKIWTIVVGEPSPVDGPDIRRLRTGLLTRFLRARGHDVTWFNGTMEHARKTQRFDHTTIQTDADGTTLVFLHGRHYDANVSFARIANHMEGAKAFAEIAPRLPQPDVIACSWPTLELAAAVACYARARNIPFILDLRDMWPDMIAEVVPARLRPLARLAMWPWFVSARRSMRAATALVGMSGPFLDWGLAYARRPRAARDRVFHLASDPETAAPESIAAANAYWDDLGVRGDVPTLVFSGTLSARHDFETVLAAARMIDPARRDKIRIVFCGKGEAEGAMQSAARDLPHVVFAGWRNLAEIQALFARAHAGILPYRSTTDFTMAFPNKVGEYTGAGLPIVTCLAGEVGALIDAEACGLRYRENDAASLAAIFDSIIDGTTDLAVLGVNARASYLRHFDSRRIYNDYADYLEQLARETKTPA